MSRLHTGAGDATVYTVLSATLVPNAALFTGSYLLGPGFLVGTGTMVSPALVSLGPVPMFPLLAALPDNGATPAWAAYLIAVPPLRRRRRAPPGPSAARPPSAGRRVRCAAASAAWSPACCSASSPPSPAAPSARAGCATSGRDAMDVMVHAVTAFGLGGVVGGLAMTWWQRRAARHADVA